ncbi:ABC transporter substrate-binding protein [Pseudonocardia endophytica]|uniref:ABC transporter substrate-binding protein n=1 Tax=Pseudonocardia endophytica TaxID=401976 RepID=UPI0014043551|nr:ABC transporter substrate-binding protein [Pseudonocardia endophytica]
MAVLVVSALALVVGCAAPSPVAAPPPPGCLPGAAPAPLPEFRFARNVSARQEAGCRVLTVTRPFPGGAPRSVVLVDCGAPDPPLPAGLAGAPLVHTPVSGLFAASTTQLPAVEALGLLDRLTGVGDPALVSDPAVRARAESPSVTAFAPGGVIAAEPVIAAAPPVLLSGGTDDPAFAALRAARIPVVDWADYLEQGPLAQAEWIKVMGALTGRDAEATRQFDAVAARYTALAGRAKAVPAVPVAIGQPYQGTWTIPSRDSTTGGLLRDAGATWSGAVRPGSGSAPASLEAVLADDGAARIWLADGPWRSTADVAATDPRLRTMAAVGPGGQVWTRDKMLGPGGGNQYYERGVAHPDEILADLVSIVHPQLEPGRDTVYFRPVPAG